MDDCGKCLGLGVAFNGRQDEPCTHCGGTGKSNIPYTPSLIDDDY